MINNEFKLKLSVNNEYLDVSCNGLSLRIDQNEGAFMMGHSSSLKCDKFKMKVKTFNDVRDGLLAELKFYNNSSTLKSIPLFSLKIYNLYSHYRVDGKVCTFYRDCNTKTMRLIVTYFRSEVEEPDDYMLNVFEFETETFRDIFKETKDVGLEVMDSIRYNIIKFEGTKSFLGYATEYTMSDTDLDEFCSDKSALNSISPINYINKVDYAVSPAIDSLGGDSYKLTDVRLGVTLR